MKETQLSSDIRRLRDEGKTYSEISLELGCSKGSVCYHIGEGQKDKQRKRQDTLRSNCHPFSRKIYKFRETKNTKNKPTTTIKWTKLLDLKIRQFCQEDNMKQKNFTVQDVIDKFGDNPKCYLTGKHLDIRKPNTYHFDHITPKTRGGSNNLDNLGICTKRANQAKTDMTHEEFIDFCKTVIRNHESTA